MSKIRFRAWFQDADEMVDFDFYTLYENDGRIRFPIWFGTQAPFDEDIVIMRYLGEDCLDIHGKEFCEGDIVRFRPAFNSLDLLTGVIIYRKGRFEIRTFDGEDYCYFYIQDDLRAGIIGNRYQNPELFKEEQQHELSTS